MHHCRQITIVIKQRVDAQCSRCNFLGKLLRLRTSVHPANNAIPVNSMMCRSRAACNRRRSAAPHSMADATQHPAHYCRQCHASCHQTLAAAPCPGQTALLLKPASRPTHPCRASNDDLAPDTAGALIIAASPGHRHKLPKTPSDNARQKQTDCHFYVFIA